VTQESIAAQNVTAIDAIFDRLVIDIVQGIHPQGSRLPAERELARRLGASRPTLREALRRLGAWNLVEPRRGSGVVVKSYRDWSIEVVPAYIRHGKPTAGQPTIARILVDILALRRALLLEVMRQAARRLEPTGIAAAREAAARAWEHRDNPIEHARYDFDVLRLLVEKAGYTPGLWALNRIASIWLDLVGALQSLMRAPDDYVESYNRFFDLIAAGEPEAGFQQMAAYLERHDTALMSAAGLSSVMM
jgi:DNA-binding FadR family transcriptional regulator